MAQKNKTEGWGNSGRESGGRGQRDNLGRTSPGTSDVGGQRSAGQGRDLENRNIGQQGKSGSSKSKQVNQFEDEDELSQGFRTGDQM